MNANTALKLNDAVDQAVRCGERLFEIRAQVERAIDRAVEQHRSADIDPVDVTPIIANTIGILLQGLYKDEAEIGPLKRLHEGAANEASYFRFKTETGEYTVEVERRK